MNTHGLRQIREMNISKTTLTLGTFKLWAVFINLCSSSFTKRNSTV